MASRGIPKMRRMLRLGESGPRGGSHFEEPVAPSLPIPVRMTPMALRRRLGDGAEEDIHARLCGGETSGPSVEMDAVFGAVRGGRACGGPGAIQGAAVEMRVAFGGFFDGDSAGLIQALSEGGGEDLGHVWTITMPGASPALLRGSAQCLVPPVEAPMSREALRRVCLPGARPSMTHIAQKKARSPSAPRQAAPRHCGEILEAMPADAPGIVIVQHMPEVFTAAFAQRLIRLPNRRQRAAEGDRILDGRALIRPRQPPHARPPRRRRIPNHSRRPAGLPPQTRAWMSSSAPSPVSRRQRHRRHPDWYGQRRATGLLEMRTAGAVTFARTKHPPQSSECREAMGKERSVGTRPLRDAPVILRRMNK